jgi:hypothetical protein
LFLAVWECFNEQVTKMWVKEKFLFCCSWIFVAWISNKGSVYFWEFFRSQFPHIIPCLAGLYSSNHPIYFLLFNGLQLQSINLELFPKFFARSIHVALVDSLCPECFKYSHDGLFFHHMCLITLFIICVRIKWSSYSMMRNNLSNLIVVFLI